jgi:hypothetical protein
MAPVFYSWESAPYDWEILITGNSVRPKITQLPNYTITKFLHVPIKSNPAKCWKLPIKLRMARL